MPPEVNDSLAEAKQRFSSTAEAIPLACILINARNSQVLAANSRALRLLPDDIVGQAIIGQAVNPQQLRDSLSRFTNCRSAMPGRWQLQAASIDGSDATLDLRITGALFNAVNTDREKTLLITLKENSSDAASPFAFLNTQLAEIQRERHQLLHDNQILESEVVKRTKKIELRNEELDLLNQSLNDFVSIVSHDLAGPTRRIQSFTTLLQRELPKNIQVGNIGDFLKFLIESSQRLSLMIDGSVRLSRIQPSIDEWRRIDVDKVLELIEADLRATNPSADFTLNHRKLHQPYADAGLVEQLLQNLTHNAIKFRRLETPLVIDVSSSENIEMDYVEITVTDNGKGIGKHDKKQVLRPFSRGADVQGIPGTGMGLAICARICQQHQGRLWIAQSSTGEEGEPAGTKIRFRLPTGKPSANS